MLIVPHSTALRFNKRPYVTYAIMLLCVFVYYAQITNREEILQQAVEYCESINSSKGEYSRLDFLRFSQSECVSGLRNWHRESLHGASDKFLKFLESNNSQGLSNAELNEIQALIEEHYKNFQQLVPSSLDGSLMHYPNELNPIPMLTSAIAHSDWGHIIFNLIFFLAFSPAIEVLINNKLRYVSILIAISFITSLSYALTVLLSGDDPVPSLGLSGVVTGAIGLSAYLMPHARIRVFVWFIFLVKNFYIPAWILAVWFIGWDTWDILTSDNYGGVNLVAHVSGGFAGYLIGFFFLKNTREETQDELAEEIEYMRAERTGGTSAATYSGGRKEIQARTQEKQEKRYNDEYMSLMCRHVRLHRDSQAIVLILENYEVQSASVEIYEELFNSVQSWGDSRTLLCLGRLLINLLIEHRKYAKALVYVEKCQKVSAEFVLANPVNVMMLANMARENKQYEIAYLLVKDAQTRYGEYVDAHQCSLLEIELLWQHLDKEDIAHEIIKKLLLVSEGAFKQDLLKLAILMRD